MIGIVKWRLLAMRLLPLRPLRLPIALMEGIVAAGKVLGIAGIMLGITGIVDQAAIITIMLRIAKKKKKNLACILQIGGGLNVR